MQVLAFLEHFGIADDDARVNPYGGAIAMGHPLASSGVRLMTQLARQFEERPEVRYGMTTMCIGIGMGGTVIWENPHSGPTASKTTKEACSLMTTNPPELQSALDPGVEMSGDEVVTEAKPAQCRPAPRRRHDGPDNPRQRPRPQPPEHLRPQEARWLSTPRSTRRSRDDVAAIGVTGKPFILAAGADLSGLSGLRP